MARIWRKPGVLMTAYFALFVIAGVLAGSRLSGSASHQIAVDTGSPLVAAFLAWRVTRGGSVARMLIIVWTTLFMLRLPWSPGMKSGSLVSLGLLAICLAQIALLVSAPIYERTRKGWADRAPVSERLWPVPRWWMAAVALAAGLIITLVSLASMDWQPVSCAAGAAPPGPCVALAQGSPVHFLSSVQDGNFSFPVINKGAAAEDLAIWTVLSFAACYLIWLPSRRPAQPAGGEVAAPV